MTINRFDFVYSACSTAFTPPATPTDVFTLSGNAVTNVYVMKMGISTLQTTLGINAWYLLKRSTANTGGTSTTPAVVPFDINDPAASSIARQYSVNPAALGTLIGTVWEGFVGSPALSTPGVGDIVQEVNFLDMVGQPLSLLSVNDVLAWNFNGAALPPGLSVLCYAIWYEKSKT
jgi:hypothetical protein